RRTCWQLGLGAEVLFIFVSGTATCTYVAIIIVNGVYVTAVIQEDTSIVIGKPVFSSTVVAVALPSIDVGTREGREDYTIRWSGCVLEVSPTEYFKAAGRSHPCFYTIFVATALMTQIYSVVVER
ncbi:unnamed protein product, partial [Ectocarpus fasciculatus]